MACRLVILISGSGSNLNAFIEAARAEGAAFSIAAVISNKPDAYGLVRAEQAGIATAVVDHRDYTERARFDAVLRERIDEHRPELVVMAGFMRILTAETVRHYHGRLLNIHPSLLPRYPGLHTHRRAIEAGDAESGATVHFVTEELDGGPPVIQAKVPVLPGDTPELLAQRVLKLEHVIYPLAATWFAQGRLRLRDNRAELDGKPLPHTGYPYQAA